MPNDVVLITGANNGIGLGLARALMAEGYRVAAFDLSGENLSGLAFYRCDVTQMPQVTSSVRAVIGEWGRIDILVNNACLALFSRFEERSIEETRQEFEVNYFGYLNLITAVLPFMKEQGHGIIHNVSSGVGLSGFPGLCGYASTKGAIEAFTRTLALELKPSGIVVNLMHPPLSRTRSSAPLGIPARFMSDPQEVGRKLARKIGSSKAVVTPGLAESLGVFMARLFPGAMGKFFAGRTAVARTEANKQPSGHSRKGG
jgi:NAD(P)-dependent dehydrogenase (short-subunit alcohol dehydrogenase family)